MTHRFILKDGQPVPEPDLIAWAMWMETADRRVAFTKIGEDVEVSTVFLGTNYQFTDGGKRTLFETMVFGGELDQYQERYRELEEAMQGHERIVEMTWEMP